MVSIEIVGSRIADWDIKITDTIADNASASHWVVGHKPVKLENLDLINCKMVMENNGKIVSEGIGKTCLGFLLMRCFGWHKKWIKLVNP